MKYLAAYRVTAAPDELTRTLCANLPTPLLNPDRAAGQHEYLLDYTLHFMQTKKVAGWRQSAREGLVTSSWLKYVIARRRGKNK